MKKFFKAVLSLIVIAAIAAGVYFIFFYGTDNKQIRAKVYNLNNNVLVKEINIYSRINTTVDEMIGLIDSKGYNIPEIKSYLVQYRNTLKYYDIIKDEILEYGIFVNNQNTNNYFNNMNKAYDNLVTIYKESNEYLLGTYFAVTDSSKHNSVFIVNFQNLFKDALQELNNFYYNAAMAYSLGTENLFEINNLYKLKVGYYATMVSCQTIDYLDNNAIDYTYDISESAFKDGTSYVGIYLNNKAEYDSIIAAIKNLDTNALVMSDIKGEVNPFIDGVGNLEQKSNYEKYYNLIIRGVGI